MNTICHAWVLFLIMLQQFLTSYKLDIRKCIESYQEIRQLGGISFITCIITANAVTRESSEAPTLWFHTGTRVTLKVGIIISFDFLNKRNLTKMRFNDWNNISTTYRWIKKKQYCLSSSSSPCSRLHPPVFTLRTENIWTSTTLLAFVDQTFPQSNCSTTCR